MAFNALKVENKKLINKNVMKWMFSHWPCYRSSASRFEIWMAVLARGFVNVSRLKRDYLDKLRRRSVTVDSLTIVDKRHFSFTNSNLVHSNNFIEINIKKFRNNYELDHSPSKFQNAN